MAFHNSRLLDIYVSQKEDAVDRRHEHSARRCNKRSGAYTDTWFKDSHPRHDLGALLCYGRGRGAVLQWEDSRSEIFGVLQGRDRRGLYRWWHVHQVDPHFRA
jgi:hypothetical protein